MAMPADGVVISMECSCNVNTRPTRPDGKNVRHFAASLPSGPNGGPAMTPRHARDMRTSRAVLPWRRALDSLLSRVSPQEDVELRGEIAASPYYNPDLAPTSTAQRTWRLRDLAALWVAMAACVPTYMLASSLIVEGMNWWQAVLTIVLANIIVLVPIILNGHAGTKYGIPFPVYCRPAFGIRGANVPALLREIGRAHV